LKYQNSLQILSGGQTGVDRAALDFALANGLQAGGWCPLDRKAEDGLIAYRYPLSSTFSANLLARTEMNILNSHGTLLIYSNEPDSGSDSTRNLVKIHQKPLFVWKLGKNKKTGQFSHWIKKNNICVLNIAGPRASNEPDIYIQTIDLLEELLAEFIESRV
jgi:hypothetical protein